MIRKIAVALAASALLLAAPTGCGWVKTISTAQETVVPITKAQAQQALADIQKVHAAAVRIQIAYLEQTPCDSPGALKPPFCASLAVSRQATAYDKAFTAAMMKAQADVAALGDNPSALAAAVKGAQLALAAYRGFVEANMKKG